MKLNKELINNRLKKKNICLIEEYIDNTTFHLFQCLLCGKKFKTTICTILYQDCVKCPKCTKQVKYSIENINNCLVKHNIQLISNFKRSTDICMFKCCKCNHTWRKNLKRVYKDGKATCPKCSQQKKEEKKIKWKDILDKKGISIIQFNKYKEKSIFKCNKCNEIFEALISNLLKPERACPLCSQMKNEKLTFQYLKDILKKENNLEPHHYIFPSKCKRANIPGFFIVDFYFTIKNKEYIVEYNGIQHYKETNFRHKMKRKDVILNYKKQLKRDKSLRTYCHKRGITLFEIDGRKYTEEKIKEYLIEILSPLMS